MSRRYDSSTTTFSPEGRLHQVEYAIEAINEAGTSVGLLATDCIVLAAVKKTGSSTLLAPQKASEKLYKIDDHITTVVAGLTSDANVLIDNARITSQRYTYTYQEPMPVEQLVQRVSNIKHTYTQFGGQRPFGVAFLFAGWDIHYGYQLYVTDPSGNYSGWKASCIGQNNQAGKSLLKNEFEEGMDLAAAKKLAVKVMMKTMDGGTATADRLECCVLSKDTESDTLVQRIIPEDEVAAIIAELAAAGASEGDA
mmetsp:Transcript_39647/g.78111  ORF Transcript_39647/g.78111 Transcript_39647/m.78111 type:complete len:253 (+) Transcript_39647:82-840(+)|eukprot:CAMPEP_0171626972 /NCGR_PEP_ID=MMETSP0990-20121206/20437_1 /TAXON_ID=483369 /ORGANISM="non described non described, Strain CCMP2098" /LENGTH=252 /DNA_ID=CAMNT_0012194623 /DNA_START=174 /DNA_END=932 /DNA_ORIENTATION=-